MILNSGSRIGRYDIRSHLGSGGMGEVYLAWDTELEREIAVKVLRDQEGSGERSRRFVQEAKAVHAASSECVLQMPHADFHLRRPADWVRTMGGPSTFLLLLTT